MITIIAATDLNRAIGYKNKLLCSLPEDMLRFKAATLNKIVIMGRKTYESIGHALPDRTNIVISSNKDYIAPGCEVKSSFEEAVDAHVRTNDIMVIGGSSIYKEAMPVADRILLTIISSIFEADTFFPVLANNDWTIFHAEKFPANEKNKYDMIFLDLRKSKMSPDKEIFNWNTYKIS